MKKEKIIMEIGSALETAGALVKRIREKDNKVHRLDIEVLLEKTRLVYDKLVELDILIVASEVDLPVKTEEEPAEEQKQDPLTVETSVEKDKVEKVAEIQSSPVAENAAEKDLSVEETLSETEPEEPATESKEIPEDTDAPGEEEKSTIDLFSTAEPTVSDRYSEKQTITVADRITKEGINELREAIGINEKFLFINELFNGDMSKYNNAIDELDDLKTWEGAKTYLLELKVQNQWAEDNPAFVKLSELLQRKFNAV